MSTRVIFSIMIGADPMYYYAEKSMRHYAAKTHSDVYIIRTCKLPAPDETEDNQKYIALYQKKFIFNLLKKYDRVLYLDADVLVTPDAQDIFQQYPDPNNDTLFMFDQAQGMGHTALDQTRNNKNQHPGLQGKIHLQKIINLLDKNNATDVEYNFNAGVILAGKETLLAEYWNDKDLALIGSMSSCYEQGYINILISRYNIKVKCLNENFNRMGFIDTPKSWDGISFVHFANGRLYNSRPSNRPYYFRKLYSRLYKEKMLDCIYFWWNYAIFRVRSKIKKIKQ